MQLDTVVVLQNKDRLFRSSDKLICLVAYEYLKRNFNGLIMCKYF